jgi:hypothetical protein
VREVLCLALLHVALTVTLYARPGVLTSSDEVADPGIPLAVVLWYVGPSLLAAFAIALLLLALVSAIRQRQRWTRRRLIVFASLSILAAVPAWYRTYPSSHDEHPSAVRFVLPLDGPVTVAWGGESDEVNAHVVAPDQRWGYDLIVTENGESQHGNPSRLTGYLVYGRTVRAPAAGRVIAASDGEPDVAIGDKGRGDDLGNHVAIQVAPSEFLFIAHMQLGSIAVRTGDRVTVGQPLGRAGNSGISSEPHVHLHLQDSPRRHLAEGVPFFFHDYCERGRFIAREMPHGGRAKGRWIGSVLFNHTSAETAACETLPSARRERSDDLWRLYYDNSAGFASRDRGRPVLPTHR